MNKKTVKRIIAAVCTSALMMSTLCGCRQADIVRRNLSREADAFNSYRCITVINCLQGDVLFQMKGKCSIVADTDVDNYNYELNFNPKMWLPYSIETID